MDTSIAYVNPASLASPSGFSHVTAAPGERVVFASGQIVYDGEGRIVGVGDMAAQTRQVLTNLGKALEAVGSDFASSRGRAWRRRRRRSPARSRPATPRCSSPGSPPARPPPR